MSHLDEMGAGCKGPKVSGMKVDIEGLLINVASCVLSPSGQTGAWEGGSPHFSVFWSFQSPVYSLTTTSLLMSSD